MKKIKKIFLLILLIIVSFGILTGGFYILLGNNIESGNPTVEDAFLDKEYQNPDKKIEQNQSEIEKKEVVIKKDKKATILAAGDMMYHMPQVRSAYNGNEYNFNGNLKYIKDYTSKNDISIVNFETVAAGNNKPFSGFPSFNSPEETIDSIK
ncbi:MAG TPA: CapA family protein, partial [Tissierellaceae bacterium]